MPGNKIKQGKTTRESLAYEAKYSLGLDIKLDDLEFVHIMYRKCNEPEFFACFFKIRQLSGIPKNLEPERYDDMQWFSIAKLPENIVPAHKQAIQITQKGIFYSEHGWDI